MDAVCLPTAQTSAPDRTGFLAWLGMLFAWLVGDNNSSYNGNAATSWGQLPCCSALRTRCSWQKMKPYTIPICEKQNLVSMLAWVNTVLHPGSGVTWVITAGTLLGSVREKGHIAHETDIDIGYVSTDWARAVKLIRAKLPETHFTFASSERPPQRLFFSTKNKVHIDFWPIEDNAPRAGKVTEIFPIKGRSGFLPYTLDRGVLFPPGQCFYEGSCYPCPRDPLTWVKKRYGPEWKVPKCKYCPRPSYHDGDGNEYNLSR